MLALVAAGAIGYGRGLVAPSAGEVLRSDERPPILFLRAFSDDRRGLSEMAGRTIGLGPAQERTFEEALSRTLEACGPVVAIGRPGELIPPAGAARTSVSNETWPEYVKDLMAQSKLIVMVIGVINDVDKGLGWEVRTLFEMNTPEKVVLVAPQLPDAEVRERWNKYSELSQGKLPLYQPGTLVATFSSDWTCSVSKGSMKRRAKEYEAALSQLITTVGSAPGPLRVATVIGSLVGAAFGAFIAPAIVWLGFAGTAGAIDKARPTMIVAFVVGLVIGGVLGFRIRRV
jgi:hypothetical protein